MLKHYTYKIQSSFNISTLFTWSRIFLCPLIIISIIKANWFYAILIFLIAALTDIIDGFLARFLNQESAFGAILDPIADKTLLISCYISLLFSTCKFGLLPLWFICIIIFKELLLILGGLILLILKKDVMALRPTLLGKLNTFFQIIFVILIFLLNYFNKRFCIDIFLYIISGLNLITLMQYFFKIFLKETGFFYE